MRDRPVGELDAVPRVLPALVAQALARPRLVLDVAVAVAIAVAIDPGECGRDLVPSRQNECVLTGKAPVLREEDQPERRRVGGAVVRAVRLLAQPRQLTAADQIVERQSEARTLPLPQPADPRRQALKCHALASERDPAP